MGVVSSGSPKGLGPQIGQFANPGPTFSPRSLPNIKSWYRADLGVTIATGVSSWADQGVGGAGAALTNAVGGGQPTLNASDPKYGGQATLSFNGGQQLANASDGGLPNSYTLYLVGESDVSAIQQNFTIDGNTELIAVTNGTQFGFYGGAGLYDPVLQPLGTQQMFCVICNGANSAIYRNSTTPRIVGTTGSNAVGGQFGIGSSGGVNYLTGKIAELATFAGPHTPAQVAQMFAYFAQRYKLPLGSIVGPTFNPTSVAPCALWLRADQGVTIATGVAQWNDLSGNGNSVTQASGPAQPTWNANDPAFGGQPSLSFASASSQDLAGPSLSIPAPYTLIVVGTSTGGTFITTATNQTGLYSAASGIVDLYNGGAPISGNVGTTSAAAVGGVFNASGTTSLYGNSSSSALNTSATGSSAFSGVVSVGGGSLDGFLNGSIAEVLVYTGALSGAQLAQLLAYFAQRYNMINVG